MVSVQQHKTSRLASIDSGGLSICIPCKMGSTRQRPTWILCRLRRYNNWHSPLAIFLRVVFLAALLRPRRLVSYPPVVHSKESHDNHLKTEDHDQFALQKQ